MTITGEAGFAETWNRTVHPARRPQGRWRRPAPVTPAPVAAAAAAADFEQMDDWARWSRPRR